MMKRRRPSPTLLMLQLAVLLAAVAYPALPQIAVRLWSVDLSKDQDFQRRLQAPEVLLSPPTIDFLNDKQIIVSFEDDDPDKPDPSRTPFGFHVLEVEATSGALGAKLSFKVLTRSQAMVAADGTFLVLAGEELKKFSGQFKEVASLPTPLKLHGRPTEQQSGGQTHLNPRYETWQMDIGPGGREVVLAHVKNPQETEFRWLRTADFATVAATQVETFRWQMSAGNRAVLSSGNPKTLLISPSQQTSICAPCLRAYFITDDLMFLDERDKYEIKTVSGKTQASGKLNHEAFKFHRAANASRFVYATGGYTGSGFPLKTHFAAHTEINVFDWRKMKQVAQVTLDQPEKAVSSGFRLGAIALSPDGRLLVVLSGSILNCYKLP
jgi:hypothetical protein